jgi:chromate transport protein ChrA
MTVDEMARNLRRPINISAISIMGAYTSLWGVWLLLPWDSLKMNMSYNTINNVEPLIGGVAIVIGLLMFYGAWKTSYKALRRGAAAGHYFWFVMTLISLTTCWQCASWITSLMVTIYCVFIAANLKVNKNLLDNKNTNNIKP